MTTQGKLVTLELISGVFGWGWIAATAATLYFAVMAIGFDGSWWHVGYAVGAGMICKWLAKGFEDSKNRVAFEAKMIANGMSKEEAVKAWLETYKRG